MHVAEVRFESFKSLYDVTCSLERFTVITGPNGAGKSNLVDAINFLGEVYGDGLEFAVGRSGGYDNIAHRRTSRAKQPISISVEMKVPSSEVRRSLHSFRRRRRRSEEVELPSYDISVHYRHSFTLATASQALVSDFRILEETVEISNAKHQRILTLTRDQAGAIKVDRSKLLSKGPLYLTDLLDPWSDAQFSSFLSDRVIKPTTLAVERFLYAGLMAEVANALGRTRVFQLSPFQCRATGVPTPNAALERHGENLPGVADHLIRNDPQAWDQVQRAMRDIMPGLREIEVKYTEDRRLALRFREKGVRRPWNMNEVSDGSVQSLALFIALYDARTPLLVIEEPENSIHPWILRQFVDWCQAETSPKQIIMTTHSPVLLNYVDPRVVRLMSIDSGRSNIMPFLECDPELQSAILDGHISLFDAYDSGDVRQAIPRGLAGQEQEGLWGE